MPSILTQARLFEVLDYERETGIFRWRVKPSVYSQVEIGDRAGCLQRGYRKIKIDGKIYYAQRLVWLWKTGTFPRFQVDHVNRRRDDNRLNNLREATGSQNRHNAALTISNTSGVKGVGWNRRDGNWAARIRLTGKHIFLGYFANKLDAAIAYNYHALILLGQFAKLNPIPDGEYAHD